MIYIYSFFVMEELVVKKCFYDLKKSIEEFYSKNAKADTEGLIDLRSILRGCAKVEYALEGQYKNILIMEQEDRRLESSLGDTILDLFSKHLQEHLSPRAGPIPEMIAEQDNKQNRITKWAIALGRLELARDEVERLEKLEEALRIAKDT